jgi:hypothetical protein
MRKEDFEGILSGLREALAHAKGEANGLAIHELPDLDVASVRAKTKLSQGEFARAFGVALGTLQGTCACAPDAHRSRPCFGRQHADVRQRGREAILWWCGRAPTSGAHRPPSTCRLTEEEKCRPDSSWPGSGEPGHAPMAIVQEAVGQSPPRARAPRGRERLAQARQEMRNLRT